ncbi:MAG TPA: acyl-ACP desaturase [Actinomycetes bacterium]|nr:acyl-ACP desaturase [Actinomycetes bacterium]
MPQPSNDQALLRELEPVAAQLLDRHLSMARDWLPHEYVPWSQGRDFDTEPWTPDQPKLTGVAQIAFEVNLLTEDNLPSYHREILGGFARDGAWSTWAHRWTAEEGRHSIVLRDYLLVTRNIDPTALEQGRMDTMQAGYSVGDKRPLEVMAYVAFQELATRISHRNTGRYSDDPVADRIMARISQDENLHMIFYRDALSGALELDPSAAVRAIAAEVARFEMPGTVIPGYLRKAAQIARAGIYNLRVHHDEVIWPLLRHWRVFELEHLDAAAEQARQRLRAFLTELDRQASRFEARQEERRAAEGSGLAVTRLG